MKQIDKLDARFEQQLGQSARRLRDQQNYALPVRKLPYRPARITWVASAAAAAIGWFVGIAFPIDGQQQPRTDSLCCARYRGDRSRPNSARYHRTASENSGSGKHGKSSCKKRK